MKRWRPELNPRTVAMAKTRGADYREGWEDGVRAAAQLAGTFDAQIDHPYRFEDVILCKFNLRSGHPRKKVDRGLRVSTKGIKVRTV